MAYTLPVVRMVATACRHATIGVNAQIGALSGAGLLLTGDPAPPTFAIGAIADEAESAPIADGGWPAGADPALAIVQAADWPAPGERMTIAGTRTLEQAIVALRYYRRAASRAVSWRDWQYTARAIVRMFRDLFEPSQVSLRTLAQVNLVSLDELRLVEPWADPQGSPMVGALIATMTVRDLAP